MGLRDLVLTGGFASSSGAPSTTDPLAALAAEADLGPEERARLLAAIDDGIEDFERGDHMDGFDFIAQMRAKREAAGR